MVQKMWVLQRLPSQRMNARKEDGWEAPLALSLCRHTLTLFKPGAPPGRRGEPWMVESYNRRSRGRLSRHSTTKRSHTHTRVSGNRGVCILRERASRHSWRDARIGPHRQRDRKSNAIVHLAFDLPWQQRWRWTSTSWCRCRCRDRSARRGRICRAGSPVPPSTLLPTR